ncbi:MAG: MAB_1171c family putative transporter [Pseudonocardiaceae bacterium]
MNDWLETAGLISLWLAAILRAPAAARHPCQRPLWLGTCLIAVTTTLYQEPVIGTLGRLIGDFNLIDLSRHVSHTVTAAVMLYCVLVVVGRQRQIWLLASAAAVTIAATIWLNLSAAPHARSTITTPELPLIYWLLCFGFYLVADGISVVVCWQYGRRAGPGTLRQSLRIFGLSRLFGCLLWILFPAYLITRHTELLGYIPPLTGIELLLQAGSVLLPGIDSARHNLAQRRILWALWPLWQSLTSAIPNLTPPGRGSRLGALATTNASVNSRLYRLVIEIRDAGLILRAYATPATITAAQQFAATHPVPAADLEAATVACWLHGARQATLAGISPHPTVCEISSPGGNTLREEIEFLLSVACFYAGPLPAQFATHHAAEVG